MSKYCSICDEAWYWYGFRDGTECTPEFHYMFNHRLHNATGMIRYPKNCSICKKAMEIGIFKLGSECCPFNHEGYLSDIYKRDPKCEIKMPYLKENKIEHEEKDPRINLPDWKEIADMFPELKSHKRIPDPYALNNLAYSKLGEHIQIPEEPQIEKCCVIL